MKAVIVTGGRSYDDYEAVRQALDEERPDLVIQGGATGADGLAIQWAGMHVVQTETHWADWDGLGRRAGPVRNAQMADRGVELQGQGWEVVVLRFPGGAGTRSMERCAVIRGLRVRIAGDA